MRCCGAHVRGEPHTLLRFVVSQTHRVVHTEADLWECVQDAPEPIQTEISRAEGVEGFWDRDGPKHEVPCQNVLWPRLRDKLRNWQTCGWMMLICARGGSHLDCGGQRAILHRRFAASRSRYGPR